MRDASPQAASASSLKPRASRVDPKLRTARRAGAWVAVGALVSARCCRCRALATLAHQGPGHPRAVVLAPRLHGLAGSRRSLPSSCALEAGLRRTRGARADGRSAPCAQALVPNSVRTPLNLIRPLPLLCTHARMHACIQHPACSMPAAMLPVACCLRRHPRRASVRDSSTVRHLLCLLSIFLPLPRPPGPSALSSKLCAQQSESHHLDQCHAAVLRCIPAAPTLPRFHRSSLSLLELVAELVRPVPSSHHLTDESLACTPNFFFRNTLHHHPHAAHTYLVQTRAHHTTRPDSPSTT